MSSQTLEHNFCTVCNARIESIGPPLPVGKIGQILEELNNESKKLESRAEDSTYAASIMSYASSRASITERRPSLPRSFDTHHSLRERIQEFPTRLFKRSDSARSDHSGTRRSSISTDEQRLLLRVSSEASEIRGIPRNNLADLGVFVRNRIKPLGTPQSSYQTTAVSSSCKRIALVGLADFTIYDVSTSLEISIVCWGDITQRYAPQPKTAIAQKGPGSYYKSALTDDILAIASFETFIDIRNARSGQRINQLRLERGTCRTIGFSPDSQRLVIGLDNGDVLVYQAGIKIDFAEPPVAVGTDSPITSIVFSHDSLLMAVCTQDNIVRAYRLGNLSDGFFEQFVEPSVYGKRSKSADIADLALYPFKCF
jgi:WD40 repeat protein